MISGSQNVPPYRCMLYGPSYEPHAVGGGHPNTPKELEIVIRIDDEIGIIENCVGKTGDLMGFIGIHSPPTNTNPENHEVEEGSFPSANGMVYVRCRD